MLRVSRILFILAAALLVLDAVLMATGSRNPLFGWPLPCPVTLVVLAAGIILFALKSTAFSRR